MGSINCGVGAGCGGGGGAAGLLAVGFEWVSTGEMAGSVVSAVLLSMVGGVVDGCMRSFEVGGPFGVVGAGTVVDVPFAWIDRSPSLSPLVADNDDDVFPPLSLSNDELVFLLLIEPTGSSVSTSSVTVAFFSLNRSSIDLGPPVELVINGCLRSSRAVNLSSGFLFRHLVMKS